MLDLILTHFRLPNRSNLLSVFEGEALYQVEKLVRFSLKLSLNGTSLKSYTLASWKVLCNITRYGQTAITFKRGIYQRNHETNHRLRYLMPQVENITVRPSYVASLTST
jgi:hypothetical protein